MNDIPRDTNVRSSREESPIKVFYQMAVNDQIQNDNLAEKLSGTKASSRATRMRFVVCTLGLISLAMGQISRTVINYSITSMVDPRMLNTNRSVSTGGSCPYPQSEFGTDSSMVSRPEVDPSNGNHLLTLTTTEQPETLTSIEDSLVVERLYEGRSETDSNSEIVLEPETTSNKFMWTVKQQSLIKGGFFYSYFFFMILGGRIAEVYGAKHVILIGVFGSAIINLATPFIARYNFPLLIASRIIMGTIQSAGFPAMYALINKWLTMSEASIYAPMLKMSIRVGQVLASMAPGLLPDWPYVFYLFGLLGLVWSILWLVLATSEPDTNHWVSESELLHITKNKRKKKPDAEGKGKASLKTPWLRIISSPSVIGLVLSKLAFSCCNSFITIELPSYLRYVYHASLQEMSMVTTVMFSIQVPLTLAAGWLAKVMVQKHPFGMSTTAVRKIFQSLATFGTGLALLTLTLSDCNLLFTGVMLQIVSIFAVFVAGGETMLPYDLSDEYPATIMAIANSMSNLSGIGVTAATGFILGDQGGSQSRWNTVILMVAAADILGGLIFCLLVKAEPIDFDSKKLKDVESTEDSTHPNGTSEIKPEAVQLSELAMQTERANELMLGQPISATYTSNGVNRSV